MSADLVPLLYLLKEKLAETAIIISLVGCVLGCKSPDFEAMENIIGGVGKTVPASSIGTASRIFASPTQYPPKEFAAYGILAFRSRSSAYDRDRHLMICNAYVATISHASELAVPRAEQMVTVWPLNLPIYSNRLNQLRDHVKDICPIAVDNYGLVIAQRAIKDAERTGVDMTGIGPLLLAWSPSTDKGKRMPWFL